ncbi:tRNA (cytidine(34)-2'-O)-methyltransferase [Synechococcus sp. RSCCF101]|nr:tRNA (cytidine(34)-2'-O)-methyltransferase [Synechococcus sp. RSCCF101]QEY33389.1 tRNA (cytidine(34)-2'-O)-methyltransferase [Synechococcus sp. RSCCF101]
MLLEPQIPPNTGNVARSCAGFRVPLHLVQPLGFSLEDRHLRRAGLDYWPWVDLTVHEHWEAFEAIRARLGGRLVAFSRHGDVPLTRLRFQAGDWLLFGREDRGLPEAVRQQADVCTTIPMPGGCDAGGGVRSFNLASACAIGLFEALRQTDGRLD